MFYDSKFYFCLLIELICFVFILSDAEMQKHEIQKQSEIQKQIDIESIHFRLLTDYEFRLKFDELLRSTSTKKNNN